MSDFIQKLGLCAPIMQAPMAGASDAGFVSHACQLGVLGSLGAGMMSPSQIHDAINDIKAKTNRPFNINLMILSDEVTEQYSQPMPAWLADFYDELGVAAVLDAKPAHRFLEQFSVLLGNPVPVASFTFGILDKAQVDALHEVGSLVVGTANQVDEVLAWQSVGADAVVVQGKEAGGHQGGWLYGEKLSTLELLSQSRAKTCLPLIAAGGIANRQKVQLMLDAGADLVAVGTAFLTTHESVINPLWQEKLQCATAADTALTRLYSGKWARGITTDFMRRFAHQDNDDLPIYPTLNAMTKSLRAHSAASKNSELMSLWCGMGIDDCQSESMSNLVQRLTP